MSQSELIFRGINAEECTSFIREVHKRAHESGRLRDNAWMADTAMIAFDGDALKWFDDQTLETRADWTLLRRELLQRYCSDNQSSLIPVPPKAAETTIRTIPAQVMNPSQRLTPSNTKPMLFNILVVVPKAHYRGYISQKFEKTDYGRCCCTLTQDQSKAQALKKDDNISEAFYLLTADSGQNEDDVYWIAPHLTSEGALTWFLALWLPIGVTFDGECQFRHGVKDGEHSPEELCSWTVDLEGKLTSELPPGAKAMITKTPSGGLTITFWKCRVWDDDDDAYIADFYLVRTL